MSVQGPLWSSNLTIRMVSLGSSHKFPSFNSYFLDGNKSHNTEKNATIKKSSKKGQFPSQIAPFTFLNLWMFSINLNNEKKV